MEKVLLMVTINQQYKEIINALIPHFEKWYKVNRGYNELPTTTQINSGDCFVMATLVYLIALQRGLNPVIYCGSHHVWIMENNFVFDAYFPEGITLSELKDMPINIKICGEDNEEPPFYHGGELTAGLPGLKGYYFNCPDRAIFVEAIIKPYQLSLPVGLRKYLQRHTKHGYWNRKRNAMKRYLLRNHYG